MSAWTLLLGPHLLLGCGDTETGPGFIDRAREAGLNFIHHDGRSGRKYLLETLGSGVAFFDFDDDGWLDVYCVNGADLPGLRSPRPARDALFRNRGHGVFEDITEASGTGHAGYGFGCAAADVDGDGRLDLYVTNFGGNVLYRNLGGGRFADVTKPAGVAGGAWSTGAAFADLDGDGDLDLYVANYVEYKIADAPEGCREGGISAYCHPKRYRGAPDVLYKNNGDGTFIDATARCGIAPDAGKGLGVVCGDYDADGDQDIFVANDTTANLLYQNQGGGNFREVALLAGVAYSEEGKPQSGMGVDLADYDGDGWLDFGVTNFTLETNSLYRSQKGSWFIECSYPSGTGKVSFPLMGWGTRFFDFDHDGLRDWFVVNGHLQDNVDRIDPAFTYRQRNLLFRNVGGGTFVEAGEDAGPALRVPNVGRGAAFGDADNDGDIDILVSVSNGPLRYLRREGSPSDHWVILDLRQDGPNPFAIGALVTARAGDLTLVDEVRSGGSYLSQNDLRIHFGLGKHAKLEEIRIRWPDGGVEKHAGVEAGRIHRLRRGSSAAGR